MEVKIWTEKNCIKLEFNVSEDVKEAFSVMYKTQESNDIAENPNFILHFDKTAREMTNKFQCLQNQNPKEFKLHPNKKMYTMNKWDVLMQILNSGPLKYLENIVQSVKAYQREQGGEIKCTTMYLIEDKYVGTAQQILELLKKAKNLEMEYHGGLLAGKKLEGNDMRDITEKDLLPSQTGLSSWFWTKKNLDIKSFDSTYLKPYEKNLVDVLIWEPHSKNVGHVAMKFNFSYDGKTYDYVSFWPEQFEMEGKSSVLKPIIGKTVTYEDDLSVEGEGCKEFYNFYFYTLDEMLMSNEFEILKEKVMEKSIKWQAKPDLLNDKCRNCATFVWQVLVEGGMEQYMSSLERTTNHISGGSAASSEQLRKSKSDSFILACKLFPSPLSMIPILKAAKLAELKAYPILHALPIGQKIIKTEDGQIESRNVYMDEKDLSL